MKPTPELRTPAVLASDVSKTFGDLPALRRVSLTVGTGEIFGILGPNGAGKTTFMEIVEGLQRPDSGLVNVFDMDVLREAHKTRAVIGVVSQDHWLPALSRLDEIAAVYALLYEDGWNADELFQAMDLEGKRHSRASRLSAGQRQRFAFGLAVMGRPRLLFLDEPTTALDPQARRFVWDFIRRARAEWGCTVLLTTHSMEEAQSLCDRVMILNEGRVIDQGPPRELIARHCPGFAVRIAGTPAELGQITEQASVCGRRDEQGQLVIETGDLSGTVSLLTSLDLADRVASVEPRTLEDVFIKLTGKELRD